MVADAKRLMPTVAKLLLETDTVAQGYTEQDALASGPATRETSGLWTVAVAAP